MLSRFWVALAVVAMSGSVHAAELIGIKWQDSGFNISTGDLASTTVNAGLDFPGAFAIAAERWNNSPVPFEITVDTNTQQESCTPNGPNTTYFSDMACDQNWNTNVLAVSITWSTVHDGAAINTSVLFNDDETWAIYNGNQQFNIDFTRVAVHELGHSMGLGHSNTLGAIMEPIAGDTNGPQSDDLAGIGAIYNIPGLLVLPDINNSGSDEVAAIRSSTNDGRARVQVREIVDGTRLRSTFTFFSGYTPIDVAVVDDVNSNGVPEIAVLQSRNTDGRALLESRDPETAQNVNNLFFSPNHTALALATINDISGNNVDEAVVLMSRNSDGSALAQIRDMSTKALVRNVFYTPGTHPFDMAIVPDQNGNGAPEIAAALRRFSDSRVLIQTRDSSTGAVISNSWMPTTLSAFEIIVIDDVNGNGAPETATLVQRNSDGIIGVRISDIQTGAAIGSTRWYRPAGSDVFAKFALQEIPDANGNGITEVGLITQTRSSQRTVYQHRDASTGAQITSFFVSPDYDIERMVLLPSLNGNNSPEIGFFGYAPNYDTRIRIYDSATEALVGNLFYPNLQ